MILIFDAKSREREMARAFIRMLQMFRESFEFPYVHVNSVDGEHMPRVT